MAGAPDDDEKFGLGDPAARGVGAGVADAVRKVVLTGLGAVFLTEEGARKLARDWKLPKEIVGYITAQAGGAKDEIVRVVTEEVRKFFESEALRREFLRALSSMSIEVHAEVRLKPAKGGSVEPEVKVHGVKPRMRRRPEEREDEGTDEG
jgi:hypothetical protein